MGSGYYYTLIAFSPTERLSVKGQLFKKTSLLRCLSVGNVIDDKLELDHLFLAIFRKAKMRSGYNSNLNPFTTGEIGDLQVCRLRFGVLLYLGMLVKKIKKSKKILKHGIKKSVIQMSE